MEKNKVSDEKSKRVKTYEKLYTENVEKSLTDSLSIPSKITFPDEKKRLKQEIKRGASSLHIFIPNNGVYQFKQKAINFSEYTSDELASIENLTILHSVRTTGGYSKPAVIALSSLVKNAKNLKKITLTYVLADDFLQHINTTVHILLDFSCSYAMTDPIHPQSYLEEMRDTHLKNYQDRYPNHQISSTEIINPLTGAPFT
jgi:hypothetical protein